MIISIIILLVYCSLISMFVLGFNRLKAFKLQESKQQNSFSIIIPFRNEAKNLPILLENLKNLIYPIEKYEIILVDDASSDNSVEIIEKHLKTEHNNINIITNVRKTNSPKKDAINTAISQAKFDWIITTDADCIVPKKWLKSFDSYIEQNSTKMIVGPVTYKISKSFLDRFQLLDFLSLQGVTIGAFGIKKPFLCNGANLCYSKTTFNKVGGFSNNSTIASGDDIFLLEEIHKKHPDKVHYLKTLDALVTTKPEPTIHTLIQQRIRWAAKTTGYNNLFAKLIALSVFSINSLIIVLMILNILGYSKWLYLLYTFLLKYIVDAILLLKTSSFFQQKKALSSLLESSLIYPFFSMFVAIASLMTGFQWKGRQFKK